MGPNPYDSPRESQSGLPPRFAFHFVSLTGLAVACLAFGTAFLLILLKQEIGTTLDWTRPWLGWILGVGFWGGLLTFAVGAFLRAISR